MIAVGQRVRVAYPPGEWFACIRVRTNLGTVVGPDPQLDGYWIVELDEPAETREGEPETIGTLSRIREAEDNLEVVT